MTGQDLVPDICCCRVLPIALPSVCACGGGWGYVSVSFLLGYSATEAVKYRKAVPLDLV